MKETVYDVIIVGAGAAGLAAAIFYRRLDLKVLLLDSKTKIGAKILMSGGNRCNVTNVDITEKDYESESPRFVRDVLRAFSSEKTLEFFSKMGVALELEPSGKYFPATQSAQTVLDALLFETRKVGVVLKPGCKVTEISFKKGIFSVEGDSFKESSKKLLICTGGLSHPDTGSEGAGYLFAKKMGHSLIQTSAALTPLLTQDADWKKLRGLSFPIEFTLWVNNKKDVSFEGPLLFTHFGFSGPAALNISRHWHRQPNRKANSLTINFLPSIKEETFKELFIDAVQKHADWQIKRFLSSYLPQRFVETFLNKIKINDTTILNQIFKKDRELLIQKLFKYPLEVSGIYGYKKAEVTAGGINLNEVNPKTMESKIQPGLFFAGEVLDVDGRIGGFNFQWAWASAHVAANGVNKT